MSSGRLFSSLRPSTSMTFKRRFKSSRSMRVSLRESAYCRKHLASESLGGAEKHLDVPRLARVVDAGGDLEIGGGREKAEEVVERGQADADAAGVRADVVDA